MDFYQICKSISSGQKKKQFGFVGLDHRWVFPVDGFSSSLNSYIVRKSQKFE